MASVASPVSFSPLSPVSLVNFRAHKSGFYLLLQFFLFIYIYPAQLLQYKLNCLTSVRARGWLCISPIITLQGVITVSASLTTKENETTLDIKCPSLLIHCKFLVNRNILTHIQFDVHSEWLGISIRLSMKNSPLIIRAFCSIDALTFAAELNKHSDLWG